jgi:hypothetical protein
MAEKNLVEEAIVQIQNLEEAINENAKEILASTMKEEISELVKESMKNEAEEDELDADINVDDIEDAEGDEDEIEMDMDMDMGDDEDEMDMDMDMDMDSDDETIDLTDASDEEVLAVFKKMSNQDSISIEKEGDYIHLDDNDAETEYLIQTESEEQMEEMDEMDEMNHMDEMDFEFGDEDGEEVVYDLDGEEETPSFMSKKDITMYEPEGEEEEEEIVYEIEMDSVEEEEEEEEFVYESTKPKVGPKNKLGDAKTSIYKTTPKGGFNEKKAHANPTKGTGKPKFEFKEGQTHKFDMPSPTGSEKLTPAEAKEAARTYGFGSKKGRGLRKGITNNRNLTFESREIMEEVEMLRAKNEEYRKALNLFRDKLNEVAIFNSNLAYATRLFTEHSTSKQEKINILRRFDSADTLKESKALYRTIKEELGTPAQTFMNESIEKVIEKAPQSGSAINLIESKTYENPQFMRMKDIMSKIIK